MVWLNRKIDMDSGVRGENSNNGNKKAGNRRRKGVAGIVFVLLTTLMLTACGQKNAESSAPEGDAKQLETDEGSLQGTANAAASGEDLVIPLAEVTEDASFYPIEVDGISMEVIAVKTQDGNIRTAFNTCQICYSSGRGYYEQDGDNLVCQNCGNRFSMDRVEVEAGGCNPWPIFAENKSVTEESITIPYSFLQESEQIFANWK
ncbi:DUF2318 domain-containing protein [Kineothrix sp. MB12-C1]|uniref:DUF2318 domain-containing protein n=1 Tax=Kineothrix sp. MB12-C1 TaxID=3070215 RepID=UPI0027D1F722|nr:DUF2318 domain-containing protein [Kineothrix sp. MB12-C1]WMC92372.1 DUF2318 domain-containing protein [Kineothrix sp. MB12-C1]